MSDHSPAEPCVSCERDTQPGTRLFTDRLTTRTDDGPIVLCADCNERAVSHFGRRLTDADMVGLSARAAGLGYGGPGGGIGGLGGGG